MAYPKPEIDPVISAVLFSSMSILFLSIPKIDRYVVSARQRNI